MSFFEPPERPASEPRPASWFDVRWGAPGNEIGVVVPMREVIVHRDDLVIAFTDIVAYSVGFGGDLAVVWRFEEDEGSVERMELIQFQMPHAPFRGGEIRDEFLRFGVEFADGRRATNVAGRFGPDRPDESAVSLNTSGGGGGGSRMSWDYWIHPLPPPGPVALVVEWPALGVPETRQVVEAQPIIDAGRRSEPFWDDPPPDGAEPSDGDGRAGDRLG